MKYFALIAFFPSAALAWDFTPTPVCTLTHKAKAAAVEITYDHLTGLYTLQIDLDAGAWAPSTNFGMSFEGPRKLTIGTSQHVIDGKSLRVADSGFGNVLDGLEFNQSALAFTANEAISMSLEGAARPVQEFRACTRTPMATS